MFNFLDPKLCPKVSCSSPVSDNYEVSNLISDNYNEKSRGFIVFPTIKPPVDIVFELICNVNIRYIVLNTTLGSQKCSGIEIFAKTDETSDWLSICKGFYEQPGIVFCNSKFYSRENPPEGVNKTYSLQFLKRDTFKVFLNTKYLQIVILRTYRSVPCLASIQIFGVPSRTCSQRTKETVRRLMKKAVDLDKSEDSSEEFKIPEDFKDDLTYEIMTIPMTLPSGKTVDQNTLEKHNNSEIAFGRKPCDPFTGVKFTDRVKPLLNVALKSRIDMFLLQNSERPEFQKLKRSVGTVQHSFNCYLEPNQSSISNKVKIIEDSCVFGNRINFPESTNLAVNIPLKNKVDLFPLQSTQGLNFENLNEGVDKVHLDNICESLVPSAANKHTRVEDACDLDEIIAKAKRSKHFLNFSEVDNKENICIKCKSKLNFLYEISCRHLFCRPCLFEIRSSSKCSDCGIYFTSSDVRKCNF